MNLQELEASVEQLPPRELEAFSKWFDEFLTEAWDRRSEVVSDESPPLSPAWLAEIERRSREIDEGTAKLIPYEEVKRELQQMLRG